MSKIQGRYQLDPLPRTPMGWSTRPGRDILDSNSLLLCQASNLLQISAAQDQLLVAPTGLLSLHNVAQ